MADSDLLRCSKCNGRKKIIGLGMMEKECPTCFGIGWVSKTPVEVKANKTRKNVDTQNK